MDSGALATMFAAILGLGGLMYQQSRHWRETRRDKLRDAYADWMGAISRVRRTEETFLNQVIVGQEVIRAKAAAGDAFAQEGSIAIPEATWRAMHDLELSMEAGKRDIDISFNKVCLLDRDWRRIKAAEAAHLLPTLVSIKVGEVPSVDGFNDRWEAKSRALGVLADLVNRSLALEGTWSFLWDPAERRLDMRQEELHARLNTTRRGGPGRSA